MCMPGCLLANTAPLHSEEFVPLNLQWDGPAVIAVGVGGNTGVPVAQELPSNK